jgi:monoamine oxidase
MPRSEANQILIVGAGAAGFMAAYELARTGKRITVLEARDRCGGRIYPLSPEKFGYPAEGGAEFVHGDAPLTRSLVREAGLSFVPRTGARWRMRSGVLQPREQAFPFEEEFHQAMADVKADLPIADFLDEHFGRAQYEPLRQNVIRMVQGYDLADPRRISTYAIRDEWMASGERQDNRIEGGYGRLIEYLTSQCRKHDVEIHLGVPVKAIEENGNRIVARDISGNTFEGDTAILSVPLPILSEISVPATLKRRLEATRDIGFGNVVKILLRFQRMWWTERADFSSLSFLQTDAQVPTWWTQHPAHHPVLTGWYPQPEGLASVPESDVIGIALTSLAETFGVPVDMLKRELVTSRAINWKDDPFARGAYSYATPRTHKAQSVLREPNGSGIFICGEALYTGPDIGTVEAALASGQQTARTILALTR